MLSDVITYLNGRISTLGYFNSVLCLAERIEREDKEYPALYSGNEYQQIQLDPNGSVSYWIKNGEVSFNKQSSTSSIGNEYEGRIPLKLVCFLKKDEANNDQYFADNIALSLIANLTANNAALKGMLKAKKASITGKGYNTNGKEVADDQYKNITFEPRYTHAYFSIEFDLEFTTNNQCYSDLCDSMPVSWGFVTVTDGANEVQVPCGTAYTCSASGGGTATVENSDASYTDTVSGGDTLTLPDETVNVYVGGVLAGTGTRPPLSNEPINIIWI